MELFCNRWLRVLFLLLLIFLVDEMSRRVDDLERNVSDLMTHAPADDLPADASAVSSAQVATASSTFTSARVW